MLPKNGSTIPSSSCQDPINSNPGECNFADIKSTTRNNDNDGSVAGDGVNQSKASESNPSPTVENDQSQSTSGGGGNQRGSSKKRREAVAV